MIDIDPGFRIADETESLLMKIEILQELFESLYEKETESEDFLCFWTYGGNKDDQALQDMFLNLYEFTRSSPWPTGGSKR
jgi:ATP-dependent helicase/nuclease subunit A